MFNSSKKEFILKYPGLINALNNTFNNVEVKKDFLSQDDEVYLKKDFVIGNSQLNMFFYISQNKNKFDDIRLGIDFDYLIHNKKKPGKGFNLNSKIISVYAKLNSEAKKMITIQVRKGVDKHKNTDKFTASESIIPENTDIIESDSDVDIDDEVESENENSNSNSGSDSDSENLDDIDELGEVDEELDDDLDDKQIQIDEVESLSDEEEDDEEDDEEDEDEDGNEDVDDE